jgi:hypothetical protein
MASAAKETTSLELLAAPAIEKQILIVRERQVILEIMRVFVELRRVASSYTAIEKRLEEVERNWAGMTSSCDRPCSAQTSVPCSSAISLNNRSGQSKTEKECW